MIKLISKHKFQSTAFFVWFCFISLSSSAATITSQQNGAFTTGATWIGGTAPDVFDFPNDAVVINHTVTGGNLNAKNSNGITVNAGDTLWLTGTLTLNNTDLTIAAGGVVIANRLDILNTSKVINNGKIDIATTIDLNTTSITNNVGGIVEATTVFLDVGTFTNDGTLTVAGTTTADGGKLLSTGVISTANLVSGPGSGSDIEINGSTLTVTNNLTVSNDGKISSVGGTTITVTNNFTNGGATGMIIGGDISIGGNFTVPGSASTTFNGTSTVGGNVSLTGDGTTTVGGTLDIGAIMQVNNNATISGTGTIGWVTGDVDGQTATGKFICNGTQYDTDPGANKADIPGGNNNNRLNLGTCAADPLCVALVPGTIAAAQTICSGDDVAAFTSAAAASGGDGANYDYQWQSSTTSAVAGFSDIGGATSETYDHGALAATTWFRREVTSNTCGTDNSNVVEITVNATSVGGTIASDASVCTGANGATLTLSGHTGTITKWQSSIDNWTTPVDIANTTTTQAYTNLTATTKYRAVLTSGVCPSANSADATITVSPASVGGTITTAATVCNGANGATLTLAGHTGTITKWQSSIDNWTTPVDIVNATTTQTYTNLTATTKYRAVITSGACASVNSADVTITVNAALSAGTIATAQTINHGATPNPLTSSVDAAGGGGVTYQWQSSPDNAAWSDIGGASASTYTPGSLTADIWYRRGAVTGSCGTVYTTSIKITVEVRVDCGVAPPPLRSVTAPSGAAGAGTYTFQWQSSPDNSTWTDIGSADSIGLIPVPIEADTYYRRGVSSGPCGPVYTASTLAQFTASSNNHSDVIDSPYVASTGDTIYSRISYANDIIGIGRECNLLRKQSPSNDDSVRIFIDSYAASNAANAGTITNNISYVMIGHDKGRSRATAAANTEKPAGIVSRLEREWKVTNTNFDDTYSIEIEWDSIGAVALADIRFLVDDDGDFSDAQVFNAGDNGLTFAFGSIIIGGIGVAHIPAGATKFITLGSVDAATPLPVELTNFTAIKNGNLVDINWQTASEINNDFFIVQKSFDGIYWERLTKINGAGNSYLPINYNYIDYVPCEEGCYYRLKQVDFDGSSVFSKTIKVEGLNPSTLFGNNIHLYPNPTTSITTVEFVSESTEMIYLEIHSIEGALVYESRVVCGEGKNKFSINSNGFANGLYFLTLRGMNGKTINTVSFNKI